MNKNYHYQDLSLSLTTLAHVLDCVIAYVRYCRNVHENISLNNANVLYIVLRNNVIYSPSKVALYKSIFIQCDTQKNGQQ